MGTRKELSSQSTSTLTNQSLYMDPVMQRHLDLTLKTFIPLLANEMPSPTEDMSLLENMRCLIMSRSPIDLTTLALKDRIVRQAGYNPQRIKGCVAVQAIPDWEEKLPTFVMKALVSIVKGFSRSKAKLRETPLTATAVRVSRAILPYNDDRTIEEDLVVGTLFIEALHKALLVEVVQTYCQRDALHS